MPQRREVVALNEYSVGDQPSDGPGSAVWAVVLLLKPDNAGGEWSLTSGVLPEETKQPEIGLVPINSHNEWAVTEELYLPAKM
jgi:hypothetical protein